MIQLTHSMLPLSLLILGCYTCSINRYQYTSIADLSERDNGSCRICNIECTSTINDFINNIIPKYISYEMKSVNLICLSDSTEELNMVIIDNKQINVDVSATILLESLKNECNE